MHSDDGEWYEIILNQPNEGGNRKDSYRQENGWSLEMKDNGVLMMINHQGTLIEYSPYAWQQVRTYNINMEDIND